MYFGSVLAHYLIDKEINLTFKNNLALLFE